MRESSVSSPTLQPSGLPSVHNPISNKVKLYGENDTGELLPDITQGDETLSGQPTALRDWVGLCVCVCVYVAYV